MSGEAGGAVDAGGCPGDTEGVLGRWLSETGEVVVLNTGTGLIYPETMPADAPLLPLSGSIPPS